MVCPREVLTLVKPDFKVVLPVAFADFCQVREKKTTNSVTEFRTISAVALLPTGNGSVLFASLTTGRVITRDQFTIIKDIPQEYLMIIQSLQERGVFAIEKQEEPDKDPTTAPNAAPVLPGENARENNTDSVQGDELVVLSTIVDTPIESFDPRNFLSQMHVIFMESK
jgi:hypothetical protein